MNNYKTICLNMIVKDESHVIIDTLTKLCKKINFDYWVISDTGSTDNTKELIKNFFNEKKIKGELFDDKWENFGHNRSLALKHAYKKTDYVLIFDADDEIVGDFKLPETMNLGGYHLIMGNENGFVYARLALVSNQIRWEYKGVLHEFIQCMENPGNIGNIEGNYYINSGKCGSRSKNPNKYADDAKTLEKAYYKAVEEKDDLYKRYSFYCANSYFDSNNVDKAIEWYKRTLGLPTWEQEKYISCLKLHDLYNRINEAEKGIYYLVETLQYDPNRIEGIYRLIQHYTTKNMETLAFQYYNIVSDYYENKYINDNLSLKLFANQNEYDFFLPYYMIIICGKLNKHSTGIKMYEMIFNKKFMNVQPWWFENMYFNMQFYLEYIDNYSDKNKFLNIALEHFYLLKKKNIEFKPVVTDIMKNLINLCKPVFTKYIEYNIQNINKTESNPTYFFSITTCKRYDLFEKTINSILNTWKDLKRINYFFCVDDNSSDEDRLTMKEKYPFFDFYMKTGEEKGHRKSMNIIWDKLNELKPKYWIHLEDDWLFFKEDAYITRGTLFLDKYKDKNIHQVLFNRNYAETFDDWRINGGTRLEADLIEHEKSDKVVGPNCAYWPHYSFRPSIVRTDIILQMGNFDTPNNFFERDYADKYYETGYKSAFLNSINCIHTGKLTSDKSGINSYTLNGLSQFNTINDNQDNHSNHKTFIVNLERRPDRKESMIELFKKNDIDDYTFYKAVDGRDLILTDEIYTLFKGNDFANRKNFIGCALSHYYLWQELDRDNSNIKYYTVFEDDILTVENFKDKLNISKKYIEDNLNTIDILFLGYHVPKGKEELKLNDKKNILSFDVLTKEIYVGGTFGYIITRNGAKKILDYIKTTGIKHGIDYVMKIADNLNNYQVKSHLVLSDWVSDPSENIDSDIQKDYSCFDFNNYKPQDLSPLIFFEGLDSYGDDIHFIQNKSKSELINISNTIQSCNGVNTLGFFKSKINFPLKKSNYFKKGDGIYINKYILEARPMIKIAFCDWWVDEYGGGEFDEYNNYFTNLLKEHYKNYIIQPVNYDKNPDILFYSVFGNTHLKYINDKNIRKIFYTGESFPISPYADYNLTFDYNSDINKRLPIWLLYYKDIDPQRSPPSKTRDKFCSFVAGNAGNANNRELIVKKLSEYKKVDCGGPYLNNINRIIPRGENASGKIEFQSHYKFAIAFENKDYKGYVTEKILDAYKSNCIPIYWGSQDVLKDFNPSTFINANDFDSFDDLITHIIKVDSDKDLYESYFKESILSDYWQNIFNDSEKTFFADIGENIIGKKKIKKEKIVCFIHSCYMNNIGTERLEYLLDYIIKYNLYKILDKIIINNIGISINIEEFKKKYEDKSDKFDIINHSEDTSEWELPTLRLMHKFSSESPKTKILYLHTKGIRYDKSEHIKNENIKDWIDCMLYFLIQKKERCLELLDDYDAVGINYFRDTNPHYSGNFWWTTSEHIKKNLSLSKLDGPGSAETWVLSNTKNFISLHNSLLNHYFSPYKSNQYEDSN